MSKRSVFANQHPLAMASLATPPGYIMQVAELIADTTAKPVGAFEDWPQNVVDGVMSALERLNDKARHTGGVYTLLTAEADDEEGKPYIKMQAYRYVRKTKLQ